MKRVEEGGISEDCDGDSARSSVVTAEMIFDGDWKSILE